jgi:2-polyprenyl-3-methyl-5-hydroxy-6-metoxy-1,4-benzoquinol methylase
VSSHFELDPGEYERRREGHMQRRRKEFVEGALRARVIPGGLVVELGCGPGALVASLAEAWPDLRFLGLDIDEAMIEYARRKHAASNLSFETADLESEAPDAEAQVIFSVDLVHHVHELDSFLRNVAGLFAPGGRWVLAEPNVFHPYVFLLQERMRRRGLDEDHFRPWRFQGALQRAGLVVERRRTAFAVPGWVQSVAGPVERVERVVERVPFLGGSIVYVVRAA